MCSHALEVAVSKMSKTCRRIRTTRETSTQHRQNQPRNSKVDFRASEHQTLQMANPKNSKPQLAEIHPQDPAIIQAEVTAFCALAFQQGFAVWLHNGCGHGRRAAGFWVGLGLRVYRAYGFGFRDSQCP